jgi:hypothetical protein
LPEQHPIGPVSSTSRPTPRRSPEQPEACGLAGRPDNQAIVGRAQARVRQTGDGLTSEQILELLDADRAERE